MPYWRLYYHIVWATKRRAPLITREIEPFVHRIIGSKFQVEGGRVYALNGMEDHIHVVAAIPPARDISLVIKAVKGSTSHLLRHEKHLAFQWQPGYGIFTVGPNGLEAAVTYVQNQKEHHRSDSLIDALERSEKDDFGPVRAPINFLVPVGDFDASER
jgi:REP element-mobilizing transposase RayT